MAFCASAYPQAFNDDRSRSRSRPDALQGTQVAAVHEHAQAFAQEASRQGLAHVAYLVRLLEAEHDQRCQRRAARRIKEAGIPLVKTLETFDFARAAHLPESHIRELASCAFIDRAEPVIFLGEPGTGKTHLAT
ncbi:MAG: ATP-binding protein, partial [Acidobacteria bacterium]|nr:ATP-binding protein [Acidobacteriota bacterium]